MGFQRRCQRGARSKNGKRRRSEARGLTQSIGLARPPFSRTGATCRAKRPQFPRFSKPTLATLRGHDNRNKAWQKIAKESL